MSDESLARLPPIDEDLRDQFRADVEARFGTTRGHYRHEVENALREYLNATEGGDTHDRLRRLENAVEDIQDTLGVIADGQHAQKEKTSEPSSTTLNRLDAIEEQIHREAGGSKSVHESVINAAIEDHAGGSGPTLRRYKRMLKERHRAFENPHEQADTWFLDEEIFVHHVEDNFPHRNHDIAAEYGRDWYEDVVDRVRDEDGVGRTFQ